MKKKKRSDNTTLMIAGTAAAVVAAVGLVIAGILLSSDDDAVQVQQSTALTSYAPSAAESADTAVSDSKENYKKHSIDMTGENVSDASTDINSSETEKTAHDTWGSSESEISSVTEAPDTSETAASTAEQTEPATASASAAVPASETAISSDTAPAETAAAETETTAAAETETTAAAQTETTAAASYTSYDKAYFANDLFIGDSIYTGLYLYEYFPQSQVFAKVGLNPKSARTASVNGTTASGKAASMKPARIFIMLGSNGLAYMSASGMADNIKALVGELKAESPESRIYIVSIPPVTYEHELKGQETMEMVNRYNGLLEAAAGECEAGYLDLCGILMNDSGYFSPKYAEADGLHFLGSAYKLMLAFFQKETQ